MFSGQTRVSATMGQFGSNDEGKRDVKAGNIISKRGVGKNAPRIHRLSIL